MRLIEAIKRRFMPHRSRGPSPSGSRPLREFVYLDEVSLRSLLSSQTGEVTEGKSEQHTEGQQLNADGTVGVQAPLFSKAEVTSRFQTSNSSTLQTSRKATVQSWFREFHALTGLRLIEPGHVAPRVTDTSELLSLKDRSILAPAAELTRGTLVEFKVTLGADPVFHLGTMATEFSAIVEESPEMFTDNAVLNPLKEFQPVNKILQRLLAGLIPIRAAAVDHVTVEIDDISYVVHRDCLADLDLTQRPLEIVGVTEHLAYWKDIRRVLFSNAEFTVLARVARPGLHETWTAIKAGDLFRAVAPNWDEQINIASRNPFAQSTGGVSVNLNELLLGASLRQYTDALLLAAGRQLSQDQDEVITGEIGRLQSRAGTVTGQREAFKVVRGLVSAMVEVNLTPAEDSALREAAREASGLPLFPELSSSITTIGGTPPSEDGPSPRLLDVEIVAIYW